jgi:DNA-binding response OmpR family regulator
MKVLLVEDDLALADLLNYALRRNGYTVLAASDGVEGLQRWEAEQPDLVLLDVTLPKLDGFEVCRRIRQAGGTPIILLTAHDDEADIVRGLELGADDYVTKPFSVRQLRARMEAVLRRYQTESSRLPASDLRVGDLVLRLPSQEVTKAGQPVHLTRLEFRLLYLLAMNEGQVIPYARMIEYAWGYRGEGTAGLLKAHVNHIRKKLNWSAAGADGEDGIRAVRGVGYRLTRAGGGQPRRPAA